MRAEILTKNTQGRIFKNNFLESLTKSSPIITNIFYSSLTIVFLVGNYLFGNLKIQSTLFVYSFGIVFWSLFEYLMHRYLFHLNSKRKWLKRLSFMLHGIHHQNPRDKERFFMPPIPGAIIIAILFMISYVFIGKYSFSFISGLITGYILYTQIHFGIHNKQLPKYMEKIASHHLQHHYSHYNKAYGVSSPIWDIIFQTMPPKNESSQK